MSTQNVIPEAVKALPIEESTAKKTMRAFNKWCSAKRQTPSPELLQKWDDQFNSSLLKKSFGSKEDVYAEGLKTLYSRWFNNHYRFTIRTEDDNGKKLSVSLSATRVVAGERISLSRRTSKRALNALQEMQAGVIRRAVERLKFFQMQPQEVMGICEAAIEDVYKN